MSKNKKILTIENLFQPAKNKNYVFIPQLNLFKNTANAFLIIDENTELFKKQFKTIINKKNNIKILYEYNEYKDVVCHSDTKTIDKKISFYNLETPQSSENNISIVREYQRIKRNYQYNIQTIQWLFKILNTYQYQLKTEILSVFETKINSLHTLISDLKRDSQIMSNKFWQIFTQNSTVELNNQILTYIENQKYYNELIMGEFLDLFRTIYNISLNISSRYWKSPEFNTKIDLEKKQKRLQILLKMQKTNKETIKRELYLRDIKSLLKHLIQLKTFKRINCKKTMTSLISWFKKSVIIDQEKYNYFINSPAQTRYIVKQILLKKYIAKLVHKKLLSLRYLEHKDIDELKNNLISRLNLFISNNLSNKNIEQNFNSTKIKKIISNEFWFDFTPYIEISRFNQELFNNQIKNLRNKYRKISQKKLNVFGIENYKEQIKNAKNNLELLNEEFEWKKSLLQSEFKQFNSKHKLINNKIKFIKFYYKTINDYNDKIAQKINNLNINPNFQNDYKQMFQQIENSFNTLKSVAFLFEYLELLREFIFTKFTLSKTNLIKIDLFTKLIQILNSAAFSNNSLTKTFNNISLISRLKMSFLAELKEETQIVFISDDENIKDQNLKSEFLRIVGEIAKKNNLTYTFITNDRSIVEFQNFDNIYVFFDNKLIEFGNKEKIFNNPLHPVFHSWLHNTKGVEFNSHNYIFNECFKYDQQHYLIASNSEIKSLNIDSIYTNLNNIDHDTNENLINELETYSNTKETMIVDLNLIDQIQSSQTMTWEYNMSKINDDEAINTALIDQNSDAY
ncbi:hypothetical protein EG856_01260 [Mycoplasmopsis phocirhinis]|uniref:ABC transporter ATP-binding protein n=1 Tax=Mycoplasmopsis phocirhinis TaxID=142650 RepID=A0A4P6MNH5_9BACT|nr:hypothetical protein [Mycoplasmopsis phocirhinis]QBF34553.1 hypothetical protein EG856_01260 [Mycoplasmopsis phocirhinis]